MRNVLKNRIVVGSGIVDFILYGRWRHLVVGLTIIFVGHRIRVCVILDVIEDTLLRVFFSRDSVYEVLKREDDLTTGERVYLGQHNDVVDGLEEEVILFSTVQN